MISQECLSCFHTVTFYVALNTKTKMWVFKKASFSTYISGNSWLVKKKKKQKLVTKWIHSLTLFRLFPLEATSTLNKQIKLAYVNIHGGIYWVGQQVHLGFKPDWTVGQPNIWAFTKKLGCKKIHWLPQYWISRIYAKGRNIIYMYIYIILYANLIYRKHY